MMNRRDRTTPPWKSDGVNLAVFGIVLMLCAILGYVFMFRPDLVRYQQLARDGIPLQAQVSWKHIDSRPGYDRPDQDFILTVEYALTDNPAGRRYRADLFVREEEYRRIEDNDFVPIVVSKQNPSIVQYGELPQWPAHSLAACVFVLVCGLAFLVIGLRPWRSKGTAET
ncbi:MAG: hypothetical protein ACYDCO_11615 [Armatimonadota bacterium]